MTTQEFGMLTEIPIKELFETEPYHFDPWLASNMALLNKALGLEIEIVSRQEAVGAFAVDFFGQEIGTGTKVVIENQITPTDHSHLGQLVTYAAGREAGIAVWIGPRFRDEHRKAVDWLNSHSTEGLKFFAVEVRFVRIGDSLPAPMFNVVAQPDEWRPITQSGHSGPPSERQLRYYNFFEDMLARLKEKRPSFTSRAQGVYDSWIGFGAGRSGFGLHATFVSGNRFRVELYIDPDEAAVNKQAFAQLQAQASELQSRIGAPLKWEELPNRRASRVFVEREGSVEADEDTLNDLKTWAVEYLIRFRDVFSPVVQQITLSLPEPLP